MLLLTDIGVPQDSQSLGVGGHDSVFDPVMDHLDEVTGAIRTAVQIALLGAGNLLFASRRTRSVTHARRQCGENRIKVFHYRRLTAKHHAVPREVPKMQTRCEVVAFRRHIFAAQRMYSL